MRQAQGVRPGLYSKGRIHQWEPIKTAPLLESMSEQVECEALP
jgi:hypothetical protein